MRRSNKISKLRVKGLCEGNSPVAGEFPAQRASNAESICIRLCTTRIGSSVRRHAHDNAMTWKLWTYHRPYVVGIHRWQVDAPNNGPVIQTDTPCASGAQLLYFPCYGQCTGSWLYMWISRGLRCFSVSTFEWNQCNVCTIMIICIYAIMEGLLAQRQVTNYSFQVLQCKTHHKLHSRLFMWCCFICLWK